MIKTDAFYSSRLFLYSVLPLLKTIISEKENLNKSFSKISGILQISASDETSETGKIGMHFQFDKGSIVVNKTITEVPDVELQFKDVFHLNKFFKGKTKKLPKIRGFRTLGFLISSLKALTTMSSLLSAKDIPENEDERKLLTKLYFYLLSSGISQLNKCGHPHVCKWTGRSPDRVYAWRVKDYDDVSAFIRLKAGKSKSSRGIYKRSKPFFTMYFDSFQSALGILLEKDNLIESTSTGKLNMLGAPEFGAQLGEFMLLVGSYVK